MSVLNEMEETEARRQRRKPSACSEKLPRSALLETARLLDLTSAFDLNWSRTEQRLVNHLLSGVAPVRGSIERSLKVTGTRVDQLARDIRTRLEPLANAIKSGEFDKEDVRAWPISLLKLDDGRYDRRIEKTLLARHITLVAQLIGPESPLAQPERRKGLGKAVFGALEEKLKQYNFVGELSWKLPPTADSRRTLQKEIEHRILLGTERNA
jgi:hypothetical protein